jgi:hypothetical protein
LPADAVTACHVCGDALTDDNSAVCDNCHLPFHLRQREDTEARDCGEFWVNEQYLTLEYACNICLGKTAEAEPPVGSGH